MTLNLKIVSMSKSPAGDADNFKTLCELIVALNKTGYFKQVTVTLEPLDLEKINIDVPDKDKWLGIIIEHIVALALTDWPNYLKSPERSKKTFRSYLTIYNLALVNHYSSDRSILYKLVGSFENLVHLANIAYPDLPIINGQKPITTKKEAIEYIATVVWPAYQKEQKKFNYDYHPTFAMFLVKHFSPFYHIMTKNISPLREEVGGLNGLMVAVAKAYPDIKEALARGKRYNLTPRKGRTG